MKTIKYIIGFAFICTVLYLGAWLYLGYETRKEIKTFYEETAKAEELQFYGDAPALSGFPAKPVLTYTKGIKYRDLDITFDKLEISAIPIPTQKMNFKFDNLFIRNELNQQNLELNELSGTIIIPKSLPQTMTQDDLRVWQKDVGQIYFKELNIVKNSMLATAKGPIGLDSNLQPTMLFKSKVTDYDKLITFMAKETSEITPMAATIALAVLNGMAQTNEETGQKFVEFDILIQNQKISVGPLKAIPLPKINWAHNHQGTLLEN